VTSDTLSILNGSIADEYLPATQLDHGIDCCSSHATSADDKSSGFRRLNHIPWGQVSPKTGHDPYEISVVAIVGADWASLAPLISLS
jgi:hypothetical protein